MATKQMDGATSVASRARKPVSDVPAPDLETGVAVVEESLDQSSHTLDGKRRMPDSLRRYLLKVQGGKLYLPAAYRIVWFRDECPDWGIVTTLVEGGYEAGYATVKAEIFNPEGRLIASDYKTENRQAFPAGWVEKATTGAVSRALALTGFGTQFSPELDDESYSPTSDTQSMTRTSFNAGRGASQRRSVATANAGSSAPDTGEVWNGPGQCPSCHAPEGKRHGKPCVG